MRAQSILLKPREREIVVAIFQSKKCIRGEPVESCKLRYFNSFDFFGHTGFADGLDNAINVWSTAEKSFRRREPSCRARTAMVIAATQQTQIEKELLWQALGPLYATSQPSTPAP
jgi:hypothetical protein